MSHHLDTPLAARTANSTSTTCTSFRRTQHGVRDGRQLDHHRTRRPAGLSPRGALRVQGALRRGRVRGPDLPGVLRRADADGRQPLQLHALTGAEAREDTATGELVLEGRTGETASRSNTRHLGRTHRGLVLHRPLAARRWSTGRAERTLLDLSGLAPGDGAEQLRRHHGRIDRAGGLAPASAAAARCPHRRLVRHQTRHRRRWLAADQPRRAPDDVADLLARRHQVHQPRQHPASVRGRRCRRQVHRRTDRRGGRGQRNLRRPGGLRRDRGPANCSPTSCPTSSARRRRTVSPAATAGRWPTTHPKRCSPWSPARPCPRG